MALERLGRKDDSQQIDPTFQVAPVGLAVMDSSGHFHEVNQFLCQLLGYDQKELLHLGLLELLTASSSEQKGQEEALHEIKRLFSQSCQEFSGEKRFIKKDHKIIYLSLKGTVVEENGQKFCLVSFFDITEHHEVKEALRKSEKRFLLAERAINNAIWEWDLQASVMTWNKGIESLLGYPLKQISTSPSWWIEKIHPEDREKAMGSLGRAMQAHQEFWSTEFRFLKADGQYATVSEKALIEYDESGNPLRIIGSKNDISDIRRYQRELEKAKEEALKAAEAKTAFLANISHEIRTPLSAIIGFTDFLLDPDLTPSQRHEYIMTIQRNGQMLSHLVDEILDLSKLEFHSMKVERIYFDFLDILQHVNSVLKFKAQEKGIELKFNVDKNLPQFLKSDPIRLQQILINVIGNAVKFTQKGSVTATFECMRNKNTNEEMKLKCTITDTGIGLNPTEQSRLFQQFNQADNTMTRRFGGTGLGLFLSRELAHALGGDVVLARSEPNRGSTFVVTVCIGPAQQTRNRPQRGQDLQLKSLQDAPYLEGLEILLVEDSPDNRVIICRILEPLGAHVTIAENGFEGSDMALKGHFDLVLMDMEMPVMNGAQAIQKLRQQGYRYPVIALTAHSMEKDREKSFQLGFDEHVNKPIEREILLSAISHCLEKADRGQIKHVPPSKNQHAIH